jgi:hypothetical protein
MTTKCYNSTHTTYASKLSSDNRIHWHRVLTRGSVSAVVRHREQKLHAVLFWRFKVSAQLSIISLHKTHSCVTNQLFPWSRETNSCSDTQQKCPKTYATRRFITVFMTAFTDHTQGQFIHSQPTLRVNQFYISSHLHLDLRRTILSSVLAIKILYAFLPGPSHPSFVHT